MAMGQLLRPPARVAVTVEQVEALDCMAPQEQMVPPHPRRSTSGRTYLAVVIYITTRPRRPPMAAQIQTQFTMPAEAKALEFMGRVLLGATMPVAPLPPRPGAVARGVISREARLMAGAQKATLRDRRLPTLAPARKFTVRQSIMWIIMTPYIHILVSALHTLQCTRTMIAIRQGLNRTSDLDKEERLELFGGQEDLIHQQTRTI